MYRLVSVSIILNVLTVPVVIGCEEVYYGIQHETLIRKPRSLNAKIPLRLGKDKLLVRNYSEKSCNDLEPPGKEDAKLKEEQNKTCYKDKGAFESNKNSFFERYTNGVCGTHNGKCCKNQEPTENQEPASVRSSLTRELNDDYMDSNDEKTEFEERNVKRRHARLKDHREEDNDICYNRYGYGPPENLCPVDGYPHYDDFCPKCYYKYYTPYLRPYHIYNTPPIYPSYLMPPYVKKYPNRIDEDDYSDPPPYYADDDIPPYGLYNEIPNTRGRHPKRHPLPPPRRHHRLLREDDADEYGERNTKDMHDGECETAKGHGTKTKLQLLVESRKRALAASKLKKDCSKTDPE